MGEQVTQQISDSELLDAARGGDEAAFSQLFSRHRDAGLRFATSWFGAAVADDLVSEAFIRILTAVRRGGGPTTAFRPYLYVTIKRLGTRQMDRLSRETAVDDFADAGLEVPVDDAQDRIAEADVVARALHSLPERWQVALWHSAVEAEGPEQIAAHLGIKRGAAAVLVFRARNGLRQAYLAQHLVSCDPACRPFAGKLPGHVRGELTAGQTAVVEKHLLGCASCSGADETLRTINENLAAMVAPAFGLAVVWGEAGEQMGSILDTAVGGDGVSTRLVLAGGALLVAAGVVAGAWLLADPPGGDVLRSPAVVTTEAADAARPTPTVVSAEQPSSRLPTAVPTEPTPATPPPGGTPSSQDGEPQQSAPTPVEPTPAWIDTRIGRVTLTELTGRRVGWVRVKIVIPGAGVAQRVRIVITDPSEIRLPPQSDSQLWTCRQDTGVRTARQAAVDCDLASTEPRRGLSLLIDALPATARSQLAATTQPVTGIDPDLSNNGIQIALSG